MGYGTIRISDTAHGTLQKMSRAEGKPMAALLDEAVEALRRQRFLEQVNTAYAALRSDARRVGCDRARAPRVGRDVARRPGGRGGPRPVSRAGAPGTTAESVVNPPTRGEVWLADLNPTRGHAQAGRRPVLVVSEDLFNRGPAGLAIVLPMTSTVRDVPRLHVPISPPEGGVKSRAAILCEAVRSVSVERLVARWGAVDRQTMSAVEDRLRILLRL